MNRQQTALKLAALAVTTAVAPIAMAGFNYAPIALSGVDNAYGPGQGTGIVFPSSNSSFMITTPGINASGQVVFRSLYGTSGFTGDGSPNGVFRYDPTLGIQAVIKVGDNIAGASAVTPGGVPLTVGGDLNWGPAIIANTGDIMMRMVAATNAATGAGWTSYVMANPSSGSRLLAVNGGATPLTSLNYGSSSSGLATSAYLSAGGKALLSTSLATVAGTGVLNPVFASTGANANSSALVLTDGNSSSVAIRRNDVLSDPETRAPSLPTDSTSASINASGVWALHTGTGTLSGLQGSNVVTGSNPTNPQTLPGFNDSALVSNVNGTPQILVQRGQSAPGTAGSVFDTFATAAKINNNGLIAFESNLRGPDINNTTTSTATNNAGIFTVDKNSVATMILRKGAAAPGIPGATISSFGSAFVNTDEGILFSANLPGNITVLYRYNYGDGSFTNIAQTGVPVPGVPAGATLSTISSISTNNNGLVAFTGSLAINAAAGINQINNTVLYATDASGALELIARATDNFTDSLGTTKAVGVGAVLGSGNNGSSISIAGSSSGSSGSDGLANALNDNNELTFGLDFAVPTGFPGQFTYSNGVYTTFIPEPSAALAALLPIGLLGRRRR